MLRFLSILLLLFLLCITQISCTSKGASDDENNPEQENLTEEDIKAKQDMILTLGERAKILQAKANEANESWVKELFELHVKVHTSLIEILKDKAKSTKEIKEHQERLEDLHGEIASTETTGGSSYTRAEIICASNCLNDYMECIRRCSDYDYSYCSRQCRNNSGDCCEACNGACQFILANRSPWVP